MVKRLACFFTAALLVLNSLPASSAPEYRLGDEAAEDIITPVPLAVIDSEATEALQRREARRVPVIYRFYPHALDEVEAAFHSTFVRTRSNFVDAVRTRFSKETLNADDTESKSFQRLLRDFQKQNLLFPVSPQLARIWARGESDEELEAPLIERLREAMKAYVRADTAPKDIWVGSTIHLISIADNEVLDEGLVKERGFNVAKTNFVSVTRTKNDLLNQFPIEDRAIAKYVASFIKPNCLMEADLIRELRGRRTEGLRVTNQYRAGEVIVRRGQVIDPKMLAALKQLESQVGYNASAKSGFARLGWIFWSIAGFVAAGVVAFVLVWRAAKRRARAALLPMAFSANGLTVNSPGDTAAEIAWRERALHAEQRADQAQAIVRAGLVGQLAQWMAGRMTQSLVSQRAELLATQQRAAMEMAEMAERLEKIHAPLQERLQAYEQRIADLEKELTLKNEENRELIRAKIEILRKQWEIERDQNRLEFN
ncbi:MAG TPA: hypothetical protein VFW05_14270 [Verrucomicrobiae bacterium]|nr:hypothetical protein [Verrucomicrobiae bacterium]